MKTTWQNPVQKIPPSVYARHHWDPDHGILSYEYNGVDIISLSIPGAEEAGFRHGSDGSMQDAPYFQQIYVTVDRPIEAAVTFTLSSDAVNMRPRRARGDEAILAQDGRPLIAGVNGLYDVDQDLLIDFNGCDWSWLSTEIETDLQHRSVVRARVTLCEKPFFINLRMQYYKEHLGYRYYEPWKSKPKMDSVSGWCSWEAYRRDISIGRIDEISRFLEENLKDYGLKYIQVDDGYQNMPLPYNASGSLADGWMDTDREKFPGGHQSIVETIEGHGFLPAIWTNVNITNPDFPRLHPDSLLWHNNRPLNGQWIDYVLKCTPETLQKEILPAFKGFRKLGYRYVKIDAIRHLLFDGLHEYVRLGKMTNEEAQARFRAFMEITREGLGEDVYYLASWGVMQEAVGAVDACRIAMDANPTWAGIRMQLFESARWFHTQRILFLNDPDHVCARTKADWAKSVLSLISLSGELYMLSDSEDAYNAEKLDIIRKTLPPLTTRTAETGPLDVSYPAYTWTKLHGFAVQSHENPVKAEEISTDDVYNMAGIFPTMNDSHPFSSLWAFHIAHLHDAWCVMGRFAIMPLRESTVEFSVLGLEPGREYAAFDFWEQKYLGIVKNVIKCKALSVGQCQIIALHPIQDRPILLASSRHVSMDAVSVLKNEWDGRSLTIKVGGVTGTTENYYFYLPAGFHMPRISASGCLASAGQDRELLVLSLNWEIAEADVVLTFESNQGGQTDGKDAGRFERGV